METPKPWFCYMVRCKDGALYIGITQDVEARVRRHNWGVGPQFTARRRPVELLWSEPQKNAKTARRREKELKGWTREKKLGLIEGAKGQPFSRLRRPQGKGE